MRTEHRNPQTEEKETLARPEVEIVTFAVEDVLTKSPDFNDPNVDWENGWQP